MLPLSTSSPQDPSVKLEVKLYYIDDGYSKGRIIDGRILLSQGHLITNIPYRARATISLTIDSIWFDHSMP